MKIPDKSQLSEKAVSCSIYLTTRPTVPGPSRAERDAFAACRTYMRDRLKAPSTAKFPAYTDVLYQKNNDNSIVVKAYVDAQNGFGAMIRTHYQCKTTDAGVVVDFTTE